MWWRPPTTTTGRPQQQQQQQQQREGGRTRPPVTPDPVIGRGASVIRPLHHHEETAAAAAAAAFFTYVNSGGLQTVDLSSGGWTLQKMVHGGSGGGGSRRNSGAVDVKFHMDLLNDVERNDVRLEAGTRLYFAARGWREAAFRKGREEVMSPLVARVEDVQNRLEGQLSHKDGDRRLDGTDPIDTVRAYGDVARLVLERDRRVAEWKEAVLQDGYPSSDDLPEGPWPGSTEWLTLSEKGNPIFIVQTRAQQQQQQQQRRKQQEQQQQPQRLRTTPGLFQTLQLGPLLRLGGSSSSSSSRETYCMVGTWTAEAVVSDADWGDDN